MYSLMYTFGCCIFRQAREMDKSGICASARTVASQWLVRLVDSPVKAQVAHRFFVARLFVHYPVEG
jgi:hypothetical protein